MIFEGGRGRGRGTKQQQQPVAQAFSEQPLGPTVPYGCTSSHRQRVLPCHSLPLKLPLFLDSLIEREKENNKFLQLLNKQPCDDGSSFC